MTGPTFDPYFAEMCHRAGKTYVYTAFARQTVVAPVRALLTPAQRVKLARLTAELSRAKLRRDRVAVSSIQKEMAKICAS